MTSTQPGLTTELFVSRRLLDEDRRLDPELREAFRSAEVTNWNEGIFYTSWVLGRDREFTVRAAARALANALRTDPQSEM